MSSARETVREARARVRQLAGSTLARREDAAAAVAAAEKARARAEDGSAEAQLLDEDLAARRAALAQAESAHADVMAELAGLEKLEKSAERDVPMALVNAARHPDPVATSVVDRALERAREGIRDADARATLSQEMRPAVPAAPAETPEEKARRQLAEMKAARKKPGG